MGFHSRRVLWAVIFTAVSGCVAALLIPCSLELRVTQVDGGTALLVLPMRPGERFTLRYVHSVEGAPIWEVHSVDASGTLFVEEERYSKFGAGMGKTPGVGRMVRRGPYEVIEEMHRPTGDFVLRVGSPSVAHTVIWRGHRVNLSEQVPHQAVRFQARRISAASCLLRRLRPHDAMPRP